MSYASRSHRTLTDGEQRQLLRASGNRGDSYRDHMLFAIALGTGLRCFELLGLDVGDVRNTKGNARQRVDLRIFKRSTDKPAPQFVLVGDALRKKLGTFFTWKRRRKQSLDTDAPLFLSRHHQRLSRSRAREIFSEWRAVCEFSPQLSFHALRHTFCQNVYDASNGNIRLVQKAARHVDIMTSTLYAEPSTNELLRAVQDLRC